MDREKKSVLVSLALYSGAAAACRPTTSLLCTACIGERLCVVEAIRVFMWFVFGLQL